MPAIIHEIPPVDAPKMDKSHFNAKQVFNLPQKRGET